VLGLPVHDLGVHDPKLNQGQAFYNVNALVLSAFGIAAIAVVLALRPAADRGTRRCSALAPALVVTATVNWDLFAVGLSAFFLVAWAKKRPWLAGVLLGLAVAAKFYTRSCSPGRAAARGRTGRWRSALITVARPPRPGWR